MSRPDAPPRLTATVPSIPRDAEGPVFAEPWQAQAFALAVSLNAKGQFAWAEFAGALAREIAAAGPQHAGADYYRHWLAALEALVTQKSLVSRTELGERKAAWDRAARATPHGEAIMLGRERR